MSLAGGMLLSWVGSVGQEAPTRPDSVTMPIDCWIAELGHPDFQVRDAATRELLKRWPEAVSAVRRASRSADAEVARRATDILRGYGRRPLERIRAAIRAREPDLFVERVVQYTDAEDPVWQAVTDFGWESRSVGQKVFGRLKVNFKGSDREFARGKADRRDNPYKVVTPDRTTATDGTCLFRGDALEIAPQASVKLLVARGPVKSAGRVAFVFANDTVILGGRMSGTSGGVVVCDGDFEIRPLSDSALPVGISYSVIVANGNVLCPKTIVNESVILAAGDVRVPEGLRIINSTIRAGGTIHLPRRSTVRNSKLEESVADPTAPFKFFALSRVGLEVRATGGGVRVEKVEEKMPFAATLRRGDVVTAVDGKKVESVAGFRKQIRAAFARGDCTLTVRRGAETTEMAVRFLD
ncbi:MAG TPA: PDZ domain-containing protein [Fimbriiglobus sp.]|nr:PDZ domain-containing protein [Fimbriiglobus sp.]